MNLQELKSRHQEVSLEKQKFDFLIKQEQIELLIQQGKLSLKASVAARKLLKYFSKEEVEEFIFAAENLDKDTFLELCNIHFFRTKLFWHFRNINDKYYIVGLSISVEKEKSLFDELKEEYLQSLTEETHKTFLCCSFENELTRDIDSPKLKELKSKYEDYSQEKCLLEQRISREEKLQHESSEVREFIHKFDNAVDPEEKLNMWGQATLNDSFLTKIHPYVKESLLEAVHEYESLKEGKEEEQQHPEGKPVWLVASMNLSVLKKLHVVCLQKSKFKNSTLIKDIEEEIQRQISE